MRFSRKVLGCLLILGVLVISIVIFGQSLSTSPPPVDPPNDIEQINTAVIAYWKAARAGDTERATSYLVAPPESFLSRGTGCAEEVEAPPSLPYVADKPPVAEAVPSHGLHFTVKEFTNILQNKDLDLYQIENRKIFGRNAIFVVRWKSAGQDALFSDFFLLTSTENGWRIFLIADGFAMFNKNFGQCTGKK